MKKIILVIFIIIIAIFLSLILYQPHQQGHPHPPRQQFQKDVYYLLPRMGDENKVWEIIKENGLEEKTTEKNFHNGYYGFYLDISDSEMKQLMATKGITKYLDYWGNTKNDSKSEIGQMEIM